MNGEHKLIYRGVRLQTIIGQLITRTEQNSQSEEVLEEILSTTIFFGPLSMVA